MRLMFALELDCEDAETLPSSSDSSMSEDLFDGTLCDSFGLCILRVPLGSCDRWRSRFCGLWVTIIPVSPFSVSKLFPSDSYEFLVRGVETLGGLKIGYIGVLCALSDVLLVLLVVTIVHSSPTLSTSSCGSFAGGRSSTLCFRLGLMPPG